MTEATITENEYARMSDAKPTGSTAAFRQLFNTIAGQYATTPRWNIFAG
jgi:hypothetical protein